MKLRVLLRSALVAFLLGGTCGVVRAQPDDGVGGAPPAAQPAADANAPAAAANAESAEEKIHIKFHVVNSANEDSRFLFARANHAPDKAPTIAVVPGLGCAPEDYLQLTVFLTQSGFNVALFEEGIQYGTEEKPGTRGNQDMEASVWEKHFENSMSALEKANADPESPLHGAIDFGRMGIIGHSLGGSVATSIAAHDPRFKALVTFGPGGKDTSFLTEARKIKAATLAIDGSLDRMTPPEKAGGVVVDRSASPYKGHVIIKDGNHPNAPADYNAPYIRGEMKFDWVPIPVWPFVKLDYGFPVLNGPDDPKPIDGNLQKVIAFTYLVPWLNRFVAGISDAIGATTGELGKLQVENGTLTKADFSPAARATRDAPAPGWEPSAQPNAKGDDVRPARPASSMGLNRLVERAMSIDRDGER